MTSPKPVHKPIVKPLVNSEPVSEFGAALDDDFSDPQHQDNDLTYVPGWSELRKRRDLQILEYRRGQRLGQDVEPLPVNVCWVAKVRGAATPDSRKLLQAKAKQYRPVTKDDVGEVWFTAIPPGARVAPDGTIETAMGDCQLMVVPGEVAARHERRKQQAIEASLDNLGDAAGGIGEVAREAGAMIRDPYVERLKPK